MWLAIIDAFGQLNFGVGSTKEKAIETLKRDYIEACRCAALTPDLDMFDSDSWAIKVNNGDVFYI